MNISITFKSKRLKTNESNSTVTHIVLTSKEKFPLKYLENKKLEEVQESLKHR